MKKITAVILFFGCSTSLLAQDSLNLKKYYPKPKISAIEFLIGVNLSSIRGINPTLGSAGSGVYYSTTVKDKIGYSLGVNLVHRFNKHFDLHARFLWETRGTNKKTDSILLDLAKGIVLGTATISKQSTRSNYATISISPQLLLGKQSQFNIGIGGYFGILQDSKITFEYYYPIQHSVTQNGYFNKYDYGLQFNLGYKFNFVKNTQFTVQFMSSYGIKQISKFHDLYSWSPSLYNNSYSIVLGVRLMNTKKFLNRIL
jgi:Outer membrane protein beta-barrel domain